MHLVWPKPTLDDRCALCGGVILPHVRYVLTHDDEGEMLWWHMGCRDVMIPVLERLDAPLSHEEAASQDT